MSRTILVADDSPTIRKIVELTFADSEIRVEIARDGGEAVARLDAVRPDLVLADVVMPEPSGYELCRLIKSSDRPVPVVLLAGTFEPFDEAQARDCGADDRLVKPFESEALRQRVRALLAPRAEPLALEQAEQPTPDSQHAEPASLDVDARDEATEIPVVTLDAPTDDDRDVEGIDPAAFDAVVEAVVRRMSADVIQEIARDVAPRLAAELIRERIRELEQEELDEDRRD